MNTIFPKSFLALIAIVLISGCGSEKRGPLNMPHTDLSMADMIPKPLKIIPTHSAFALDGHTAIYTSKSATGFAEIGEFLADKIKSVTGLRLPVNGEGPEPVERVIYLDQSNNTEWTSPEAYQLYITQDSIILSSNTPEGAFRGVQTLRQIIPETSNDTLAEQSIWAVPSGKIVDEPQYGYRGSMLDVARHFFKVEDVKKYIDLLAYYKMNVLHMHLSDDQGWRIEIKSWPRLTEIGGSTQVGGGAGGFYTQEEYTDIVNYAAAHYITVVPEIDMPGHTNSA